MIKAKQPEKEFQSPKAEKRIEKDMNSKKELQIHNPMKLNANPFDLKLKQRYKKYG